MRHAVVPLVGLYKGHCNPPVTGRPLGRSPAIGTGQDRCMDLGKSPRVAVVLPGTGSGADFVGRAFRGPLAQVGIDTVAVEPDPRRMIDSYLDVLDEARSEERRVGKEC